MFVTNTWHHRRLTFRCFGLESVTFISFINNYVMLTSSHVPETENTANTSRVRLKSMCPCFLLCYLWVVLQKLMVNFNQIKIPRNIFENYNILNEKNKNWNKNKWKSIEEEPTHFHLYLFIVNIHTFDINLLIFSYIEYYKINSQKLLTNCLEIKMQNLTMN